MPEIGISLRLGARGGPAAAVPRPPADPTPSADLLPALTTPGAAYHSVYALSRLMPGYTGPLAVIATGEGAAGAQDVGAGKADLAATDLPAGATPLYGLYDQVSGLTRALVQDVLAQRPRLRGTVRVGGRLGIAFGGHANATGQRATLKGGQALTGKARAEAFLMWPSTTRQIGLFSQHADADGTVQRSLGSSGDGGQGRLYGPGGYLPTRVPSSPVVLILCERADGTTDEWINGVRATNVAGGSAANLASVLLGGDAASAAFNMNMRLGAYLSITAPIGDADAGAITTALLARFGVAAAYDVNLVHIGDSIAEGAQDSDCTGLGHQLLPLLLKRARYWNLGIAGKALAQMYADRADMIPALAEAGKVNVALIDGGINDMNARTGATGADVYTATTAPFIAYLKGLGYRVGVATLLPERPAGQTAGWYAETEARRQSYNAAVIGNAGGADRVIDRAGEAHMGAYPTSAADPTLYPDGVHPSTLGYAYLAPVYAAAVNRLAA